MLMKIDKNILQWLLDGDPAIQWQTMRDLTNSLPSKILTERKKIAVVGWGTKLLSLQDADGKWARSLYSRKWISTTYIMLLLKNLGLLPGNKQALKSCKILIDEGFYVDGGINYFGSLKHSETCVTGMILSILSYFNFEDERLEELVRHLLEQQMKDGGWNCQSFKAAVHSSFHTTINVLEGLSEFNKFSRLRNKAIAIGINKGIEFLLQHKLYKSHRTGKIVDGKMTRFSFPTGWRYDVLRVLDFLQEHKAFKDERINDAIELVLSRRTVEGKWLLQNRHPGNYFFEMETIGKPSRWNTLRALRVLKWWESN